MDHTALVYLMDKQGRFVAPFSLKRTPRPRRPICASICDAPVLRRGIIPCASGG